MMARPFRNGLLSGNYTLRRSTGGGAAISTVDVPT
jgi:hypothetical protein